MMTWLGWAVVLVLMGYVVFDRLLRRGLAAPRLAVSVEAMAALGPERLAPQRVRIPTRRNRFLQGWWLPARRQDAPAVVVMHGWGGTAQLMSPLVPPLHAAQIAVLLVDARCHGESDQDSFASLPRFAEDIRAAHQWLVSASGLTPSHVAYIGHSVGAGAALLAGSTHNDVAAVVSLSAFAHPRDMMMRWLAAQRVPGWLGALVIAHVQRIIGFRFDAIAPERTIALPGCPVLLVHGDRDPVVPLADAHRIVAADRHGRARLLVLGGDHEHFDEAEQEIKALVVFLQQAWSAAPPPQVQVV